MPTIAHLSDLHLPPLPEMDWRTLLGKRGLAALSWRRRRRFYHTAEVIAALERDLAQDPPDHLAITGDLVNLGLLEEAQAATAWLERVAPPGKASVVPGNHDLYRFDSYAAIDGWRAWMDEEFPYLRRVGDIAVIGLNTGVPTAPLFATGTLGVGQLRALGSLLEETGGEGLFRLILLHHPPFEGVRRRKRLTDAAGFRRVLARHGAELVLHGHLHRAMRHTLRGPDGTFVPVLGAGSASGSAATHWPAGHYQRIAIEHARGSWNWRVTHRVYDAGSGGFVDGGDLTAETADDKTGESEHGQP